MGVTIAAALETIGLIVVGVVVGYSASKSEKCGTKKLQIAVSASSLGLAFLMILLMIFAL